MLDLIVRSPEAVASLRPDVVVLVGEAWASKVLGQAIATWVDAGTTLVQVSSASSLDDPQHLVHRRVVTAPTSVLDLLRSSVGEGDEAFLARWRAVDAAAAAAVNAATDEASELTEIVVARAVAAAPCATLVVSSSMPVRDLEWFAPHVVAKTVASNRGANGIDGVVSSAIGAALAGGGPVVVHVGDLAFLHDLTALVDGLGNVDAALVVVVADNGGGGIFSFLPQRTSVDPSAYDLLFQTARPVDHRLLVAGLGHGVVEVEHAVELRAALDRACSSPGITVVVAKVGDAATNVAVHGAVQDAARIAVEAALS
jgi:2-succinyl-5-enolpyruvyl-6-hydroxy-3-cyclohexene-1-carboxylate synthase